MSIRILIPCPACRDQLAFSSGRVRGTALRATCPGCDRTWSLWGGELRCEVPYGVPGPGPTASAS